MKQVFWATDFNGHWPVGTAAVVVADDLPTARNLLAEDLKRQGLDIGDAELTPLDTTRDVVLILNDGNY
jgi:hypothetical protein